MRNGCGSGSEAGINVVELLQFPTGLLRMWLNLWRSRSRMLLLWSSQRWLAMG